MNSTAYTPKLAAEGERVYNALESVPADKRPVVSVMVEAFINGMVAQERLTVRRTAEQDGA